MSARRVVLIALGPMLVLLLAVAGLWLARARLVEHFAQDYFRRHGIAASVAVGRLGLSGASGRFALGPADAPELAADGVELFFDPLRWTPVLVEVRLRNPLVRARIGEDGKVTLPSLQAWLDSLSRSKEKSPYVSDDLAVSFTGLRAYLATAGGTLEFDGDAKLVKMKPVAAALTLKPGEARWRDITARVESGALTLAQTGGGYRLSLHLGGEVARGDMAATGLTVIADTPLLRLGEAIIASNFQLKVSAQQVQGGGAAASRVVAGLEGAGLRLTDGDLTAQTLHLTLQSQVVTAKGITARDATASISAIKAGLANGVMTLDGATANLTAASLHDLARGAEANAVLHRMTLSADGVEGEGDVSLTAEAALPQAIRKAIRDLPALALDAPLKQAVAANLGPFALQGKARLARHGDTASLTLTAQARTAAKALLSVDGAATQRAGLTRGKFDAVLKGGGLPGGSLGLNSFTWDGKQLRAALALKAGLDFAVFKGIDADFDGMLTARKGAFAFTLKGCRDLALAALGPLATKITGQVCPAPAPLFTLDGAGWRAAAVARNVAAFLPLANASLRDGAMTLAFDGKAAPRGTVTVTAANLADAATPLRFRPVAGSGTLTLADNVWRGRLAVTDPKKRPLGTVTLTHAMASGEGSAHVEAPLVFAEAGLQPEDLSPLLAPLKKADGRADFSGDFGWTGAGLASQHGRLHLLLSFLTPLGRAHALDVNTVLTSLLPPITANGQPLQIAAIDWTIPISSLRTLFSFAPDALRVQNFRLNIADGEIALAPFGLNPAAPQTVTSTATVTGLSLAPLIAASNLSGKASLEGKVSGVLPFTAGPDGFRIKDGRLVADGPGRLELNRSLWGDSARAANAVQDFAYQALESLAFESLTADLNSVAGGRLQIVFHVKGKSDPPRPQVAEVAVNDILNGSALQKPIPLPSGTPIDLTLDTSLNFDELLKSYGAAWSKALNSGANP